MVVITTDAGFKAPMRSPLQPLKAHPAEGAAVRVAVAPSKNTLPEGVVVTVPRPLVCKARVRSSLKDALSTVFEVTVRFTIGLKPDAPLVQRLNPYPALGTAVA